MAGVLKIKVRGKLYPIKFGYGAVLSLGSAWGIPGMLEVFERVVGILGVNSKDASLKNLDEIGEVELASAILNFESLNIIRDVTFHGILHAGDEDFEPPFDPNDLIDVLLQDMDLLTKVFAAFIESMPRPEQKGAAQPQKKRKSRKRS